MCLVYVATGDTVGYYYIFCRTDQDMEQKIDKLLSSITELKQSQEDNQKEMSQKLRQLERGVYARQEVVAERVAK